MPTSGAPFQLYTVATTPCDDYPDNCYARVPLCIPEALQQCFESFRVALTVTEASPACDKDLSYYSDNVVLQLTYGVRSAEVIVEGGTNKRWWLVERGEYRGMYRVEVGHHLNTQHLFFQCELPQTVKQVSVLLRYWLERYESGNEESDHNEEQG